jgi:hypothetical protein
MMANVQEVLRMMSKKKKKEKEMIANVQEVLRMMDFFVENDSTL